MFSSFDWTSSLIYNCSLIVIGIDRYRSENGKPHATVSSTFMTEFPTVRSHWTTKTATVAEKCKWVDPLWEIILNYYHRQSLDSLETDWFFSEKSHRYARGIWYWLNFWCEQFEYISLFHTPDNGISMGLYCLWNYEFKRKSTHCHTIEKQWNLSVMSCTRY